MKLSTLMPQQEYDEALPDFIKPEPLSKIPRVYIYQIRIHHDAEYGDQVAFDVTYRDPADQNIVERKTLTMKPTAYRLDLMERFREWVPGENERKLLGPVRLVKYQPETGKPFWKFDDVSEPSSSAPSDSRSGRRSGSNRASDEAKATAHELNSGTAPQQQGLDLPGGYAPPRDEDDPF